MISMKDAFGWLNIDDRSHLTHVNRLSLYQLQDARVPEAHKKAMIRELRASIASNKDLMEGLEVIMTVAEYEFQHEDYLSSKQDLLFCVENYRPGSHRRAVANWMLGIVSWMVQDYQMGYNNWFQARQIFIDCAIEKGRVPASEMVNWYYKQIDQMRLDMACTVEESMLWLNYFEPSRLSETARQLSERIRKEIDQKRYPQAYEIGNLLASISKNRLDPSETAEVWVVIGLAAYQMGNPRWAVDYWKRGSSGFTPWSHQWAVTRWMIGLASWKIPTENQRAVRCWMDAVETFQDLKLNADRVGDTARRDWYDGNGKIMKQAMEQMITQRKN
jgi:hypothetical protein